MGGTKDMMLKVSRDGYLAAALKVAFNSRSCLRFQRFGIETAYFCARGVDDIQQVQLVCDDREPHGQAEDRDEEVHADDLGLAPENRA